MKQFETSVLANVTVADSWRSLEFSWKEGVPAPRPGQFFTLRASPYFDPLLRRPFAFSGFSVGPNGPCASAVYQVRGGATRLLAGLAAGSGLDIIGALGQPFPDPSEGQSAILIGGGIGLGPMLFLAADFAARGLAFTFLAGFRDAASIPLLAFPAGTILCTDDGSSGWHGRPTDWISRNVSSQGQRLYACGPAPMLAAVARLAVERSWPASLSAEQWMACGVGACMGCALPRPGGAGFLRACADGPVFERDDIDWNVEAAR